MIFKNLKISLFFIITLFTFQINYSRSSIQDNKKEEKSFLKKNVLNNNFELRSYYLLCLRDVVFTRFYNDGTMFKKKFRYSSNALINTTENPILMNGEVIHFNKTLLGNETEVIGEFASTILSGIGLYEIFN